MATPRKPADSNVDAAASETAAAEGSVATSEPSPIVLAQPIVLRRRKKKKRKKRYTSGLKDIQRLSHGVMESSEQVFKGGRDTLRTFRKRSDKSARKRRDGALKDLPENFGRALQDGMEASARAPYELLRQVSTKRAWRQTRPVVKAVYGLAYPLNNFFR